MVDPSRPSGAPAERGTTFMIDDNEPTDHHPLGDDVFRHDPDGSEDRNPIASPAEGDDDLVDDEAIDDHDIDDIGAALDLDGDDLEELDDPHDRLILLADDEIELDDNQTDDAGSTADETADVTVDQTADSDIRLDALSDALPLDADLTDLLAVHQVDTHEFSETLHRLGLDVEPDARAFAIALEQHGVAATVEHTDFDRVAELLDSGAEIRMGNGETLIGLDGLTDEATVRRGDSEWRIPLSDLDDRWADSSYALLISHHEDRVIAVMGSDQPNSGGVTG